MIRPPADVATTLHELAGDRWPAVDEDQLRESARHYRVLADRLADAIAGSRHEVADAHGALVGRAGDARERAHRQLVGEGGPVALAASSFRSGAASIDAFADVVEDTKKRMIVIAAMTERDAAHTQLAAMSGVGEPIAAMPSAGRYAMAAAVDDYDHKSKHAGQQQDQPPTAGGGMMPMGGAMPAAMMGGAGVVAAARIAESAASDPGVTSDVAELLQRRARELQAALPADVSDQVRMAVGLGHDGKGEFAVIVGTSEHNGYLRPGVAPEPDERVVGRVGDPEGAVVEMLRSNGLEIAAVASGGGGAALLDEIPTDDDGVDDDHDHHESDA